MTVERGLFGEEPVVGVGTGEGDVEVSVIAVLYI
jgi:hypothetical protein